LPLAEQARRRLELESSFLQGALVYERAGDNLRLCFTHSPELIGELAEFNAVESACCPFLRFGMEVKPDAQGVSLSVTGPAGSGAAIEQELSPLVGRAPTPLE
jgi:hypothetical protein